MSNNVDIISVDNNDNLVFGVPLKVGDFEIKPSEGGVLTNGSPYQGTSGAVTAAKDYIAIRKTLIADIEIGSGLINIHIDYNKIINNPKVFIYLDPVERVLPEQNDFLADVSYRITIIGIPNTDDPPFTPIFYTNMYSASDYYAGYSVTTTSEFIRYDVEVNYSSALVDKVSQWMKPGDCGLFVEFIPK